VLGGNAPPLDPHCAGVAAVAAGDPDIDEVLRLSMRQQLFGIHCTIDHRAAAALVRIALMQLCAVFGARIRAHDAGREELWPEDMSRGHMLAARILDNKACETLLLGVESRWTAVLDGLPLVLGLAYGRPMP
jgi:hypothetical protein